FVTAGIEIYLRFAIDFAFAVLHVVAVNGRGRGEAGECVKGLAVFTLAAETRGRAYAGQIDFARELSVQIKDLDLRARVFQIRRDEMIADQAHAFERLRRLRRNLFPVRSIWVARVDRDDAASRGVEVGAEPEDRAVVVDEVVRGFEFVDQFDDFGVFVLQVFVKNTIARVGPLPDADDQIAAVFGDLAAEAPLLLVFALVYQNVIGLRRAEAMIEELLIVVGVFHLGLLVRFVVAAVEESFAALSPRRARALHPLYGVGEIGAGFDLAHFPFLPIRAGGRKPVGQVFAVIADSQSRQCYRPVGRKFVRIEQDARLAVQGFQRVEHVLILQAV